MNILFIGDSLTEFYDWQAALQTHGVKNMGIAGETVQGLLRRLGKALAAAAESDLIFLMTGINNIATEDYDIMLSYGEVIRTIKSNCRNSVLIVQSILPVLLPWVDNGIIERINASLQASAVALGAEYLDIYGLFIGPTGSPVSGYLLEDGVHLSRQGYEVWSKAVGERIAELTQRNNRD